MATATELIAKCAGEGGFDTTSANVTQTTMLGWLNELYLEACAESGWPRVPRSLAPTVVGGTQYAVPDDVVDVRMVRVGLSMPYVRMSTEELWEAQAGIRFVTPAGRRAFAPNFTTAGDPVIEVWPASGGVTLEAMCAITPLPLTLADAPKIPADYHGALADGMIGLGLHRIYERHSAAAPYDTKFSNMKKKLGGRGKSRIGSGPIQAKIKGVHF